MVARLSHHHIFMFGELPACRWVSAADAGEPAGEVGSWGGEMGGPRIGLMDG